MEKAQYLTSGYSITLPVFAAKPVENERFLTQGQVQGSAFSLGGDVMLTAMHVVAEISRSDIQAMVVGIQTPDGYFKAAYISDIEDLGADLALLRVDFVIPESINWFNKLSWSRVSLDPFTPVRTVGYAYGTHIIDEKISVIVRGFQGEIVSHLNEFRPLTMKGPPFTASELSFLAPRGLSGSPLLNAQGTVQIHGMIIGNTDTRMMVFRSEERIQESGNTTVVEQYEALVLGVAVSADEILTKHSNLLGMTIEEHLAQHKLLV
jgi:trypsin-like peptidase